MFRFLLYLIRWKPVEYLGTAWEPPATRGIENRKSGVELKGTTAEELLLTRTYDFRFFSFNQGQRLFVPKCIDRIKSRRFSRRIIAKRHPHKYRKNDRRDYGNWRNQSRPTEGLRYYD